MTTFASGLASLASVVSVRAQRQTTTRASAVELQRCFRLKKDDRRRVVVIPFSRRRAVRERTTWLAKNLCADLLAVNRIRSRSGQAETASKCAAVATDRVEAGIVLAGRPSLLGPQQNLTERM